MEKKEIEKKLREHLFTKDAVADTGKLLQMIEKLSKIPMDEVVKHLTKLRKESTVKAMQQWIDNLKDDYPNYAIHDDRCGAHMAVGLHVPYKEIHEFFAVFIWNFHKSDKLSVGIALTKDGTPYRKEIEPKVGDLVHNKKDFQQGVEWLYHKTVSYEEAYPLLQELVRELPNI